MLPVTPSARGTGLRLTGGARDCYSGVLHIEGPSAISWAGKFLHPEAPDEASNEAAFAIAETSSETAFNLLHQAFDTTRDADFKDALLSAIALTRQDKAIDLLFDLVAQGNRSPREAIENSAPSCQIWSPVFIACWSIPASPTRSAGPKELSRKLSLSSTFRSLMLSLLACAPSSPALPTTPPPPYAAPVPLPLSQHIRLLFAYRRCASIHNSDETGR